MRDGRREVSQTSPNGFFFPRSLARWFVRTLDGARAGHAPRDEHARDVARRVHDRSREPLRRPLGVHADVRDEDDRSRPPEPRLVVLGRDDEGARPAPRPERRGHARALHDRAHERVRARGGDDAVGCPGAPSVRGEGDGVRGDCRRGAGGAGVFFLGSLDEGEVGDHQERGDERARGVSPRTARVARASGGWRHRPPRDARDRARRRCVFSKRARARTPLNANPRR